MDKDLLNQKFGKFEILEKLGQGGMGTVYKAKDPAIGRLVALKTLNPELLSDPKLLERFTKEARATGALDHENVIRIYDFDSGETTGQPFIAMEFIEGESLEKAIARRAPMALARKLQIIIQFCKGLDYAHTHGLVHRDVKPANILVKNDGKVKVVDFGIVHMESTTMTKTGMFMGTIQYASPEQVDGQRVDARSDIFSVGIVMYEFLAYRKPFDGTTIGAVINQILNKEPVPLGQVADAIPPELEEAVSRCMRKSPEDRFQSLDDLVMQLEPVEMALQHSLVEDMAAQGEALFTRGDLVQAEEVLRGAQQIDSANTKVRELLSRLRAERKKLESSSQVRQHLTEGEVHLKQGEFTEAIHSFEQVLKLDTQHGQARQWLEKARAEMERDTEIKRALRAGQNAYREGDLTGAELQLRHVLELDPRQPVAIKRLEDITQERGAREKKFRLSELTWEANNMVTQERFEEALSFIEGALQENPDEQELMALAETARKGVEKRRFLHSEVEKIQTMIWKGDLQQAVELAENMCIEFPQESQFTQLYEDAKSRHDLAEKERRFGEELAAIQTLIESGDFDAAIPRAGRLQKEFPDRPEAGGLLARAQTEKEQAEQQRLAVLQQEVQDLVNAGKLQEALRRAEAAWRASPGRPEIEALLANVNTAIDAEKKTRAARERDEQKRKAETEAREREEKKRAQEQARLAEEARRQESQRQLQEQLQKQKPRDRAQEVATPAATVVPGRGAEGAAEETATTLPLPAPPVAPEKAPRQKPTTAEAAEQRAAGPVSPPTPRVEPPPPAPARPKPAAEPARAKAVPAPVVAPKPAASKMPMIGGAAAVVLIVVGLVVWKVTRPGPGTVPTGGGGGGGAASAEQLKLKDTAQSFESQHQLQQALDDWNKLAQESSPLQDDAKSAVTQVQGQIEEAKNDIKAAQDAANAKKYDGAEAGYKKGEQIDAGRKTEADSGIQSVEDLKSGLSADQAEKKAFDRAMALMRNRDYKGAQAGFKSVVDKNLPNSKLIPQAQAQLGKIDALVQQQQRFDDAVNRFNAKDNDGARPIFQELVAQNTPWKGEAQGYLGKIKQQADAAATAAATAEQQRQQGLKAQQLDAANKDFEGKLNGGKYSDAEAAIPAAVSAGGSQADLQRKIQEKYTNEYNDLKSKATDVWDDASKLQPVRDNLNDLAVRAGPRGQGAKDYAAKVQNQIAKLTATPTPTTTTATNNPPPKQEPPKPASTATISLMSVAHTGLTGPFNPNQSYPQNVLDSGFAMQAKADLSGVNVAAGTSVIMQVEVSSDGQLTKVAKCISGGQQNCQAIARAPGWKFSSPTVNNHPVTAIAGVTVRF